MELKFDFASSDTVAGFRLKHFELYNWGTYNKSIVRLSLESQNALLTGDIGSGKSTIVDALTTLLVPHQKIIYNKAAGADTKERTLYSYIVGEYKSSQDENFGNAKAISLRDSSNFTVLLARFENEGYGESVTLAQFFYLVNNQVNKFFVVSHSKLSIQKDFFNFGDIRELKKRLRQTSHTEVFDSFKEYSKSFCRIMGIKNEQALNLFYQTVSLKSIGNLTDFIRTHMLESNDIDKQVDELCSSFADLSHTHELVLKAKDQIALLNPIDSEGKRYEKLVQEQTNTEMLRDKATLFFAMQHKGLLENKIKELQIELQKKESIKNELDSTMEKISDDLTNLQVELQKNGGDRIATIKKEIEFLSLTLTRAKEQNQKYNELVKALGYQAVSNEHRFLITLEALQKDFDSIQSEERSLQGAINLDTIAQEKKKKELENLEEEINYLQTHPSNIPAKNSKIRADLAQSLGIENEELPFVGELISVTDEQWRGAIERVLHSFALCLIVDSRYYEAVSDYVENTHLGGKLVYLKIDSQKGYIKQDGYAQDSLLRKLELKVDSPFCEWLESELFSRFNIPCVESMEEFRRYKKALSIHGQFKTNFSRHEKDDRFAINDSTRWVLGWDNFIKLESLQNQADTLQDKLKFLEKSILKNEQAKAALIQRRDYLRDALHYKGFESINWYKYSKEIETLELEQKELEGSSDIIKQLQETIRQKQLLAKEQKEKYDEVLRTMGSIKNTLENREDELGNAILLIENNIMDEEIKKKLQSLQNELIAYKINLNTIMQAQNRLKEHLESLLKSIIGKLQRTSGKILEQMGVYITKYPVESKEFDTSIESLGEFQKRLQVLQKDNLPKWEKKFKSLLQEKTIQGIVSLQAELEEQSKEISKKISTINLSLKDIEYSDGTYIELLAQKSNISDIKAFKESLKLATTGAINSDNNYDEQKFLQIKELIDRFNGREGYIDLDNKWRKTVTDVRNWFDFSASEKYLSDGSQKEYYAHSGGKSGGQKEKLAYTVLASSLAYQFGLEYEKIQSRSFRFVMIDEAFGRGSDESTRYALRLFEKLKLQLLVITPKQKINVIEPFVSSVHFVHNQDGMDSSLISMKIEEYQDKKSL
ncbi:MAG: ATP-binding protein [Sulfurovum sp.]|nr:ATP-binding protein [Sulfurovum sp.]MDD3499590.1 ATP-binding protein [Sulfurovum sp.]